MLMKMFSVFDTKVGAYMNPFFVQSSGAAIRAFTDNASDPQSLLSRHPQDFALFEMGSFDAQSGKFEILSAPHSLGTLLQLLPAKSNPVAETFDRLHAAGAKV